MQHQPQTQPATAQVAQSAMEPFYAGMSIGALAGFFVGFVVCLLLIRATLKFVRNLQRDEEISRRSKPYKPTEDADTRARRAVAMSDEDAIADARRHLRRSGDDDAEWQNPLPGGQ